MLALSPVSPTRQRGGGGDWGRLVQWQDGDGRTHVVAIPVAIAYGDGAELMRFLSSQGWRGRCGRKVCELLCNYLISWPVEARAVCTSRVGWSGSAFVTPERIVGGSDQERVVYQPSAPVMHGHSRKGHLDGWKDGVAELARGNSRIMLAISAAFAGPLLRRTGTPGGGLHLYGDSSCGKSNAVRAAASVWGHHRDLMRQWRATDNGLEALAEAANDGLLMLDEIKQLDSRLIGAAAYMLANGQGKARMSKGLVVRPPANWELIFLSSGEHTLQQMMQDAGQKTATGQALRIPSIPCDLGPSGLVEDLHGFHDSKTFMQAGLEPALAEHFGHAGQAWLDRVVPDIDAVSRQALELRDRFVAESMNGSTSGQIARVATRFGLVAAAGELATSFGLTGWLLGEAWRAVRSCFDAWLAFEAPTPERAKADILESVRAILQRDIGRFPNIRCEDALDRSLNQTQRDEAIRLWRADLDAIARAGQLYGFRRMSLGDDGDIETEFFVNKRAFERVLCDGQNPTLVKARLREAGWLKPGQDGRDTRNVCTPLGRQWCFVLNKNALSGAI